MSSDTITLRARYMNHADDEIGFHEYYGALVELLGEATLRRLLPGSRMPSEWRELVAEDKHLNNVPLHQWDAAHGSVRAIVSRTDREALHAITGAGGWSMSDTTCILKETARRYSREDDAPEGVATVHQRSVTVGTLPKSYGRGNRRPFLNLTAQLDDKRFNVTGEAGDYSGQCDETIREALDAGEIEYAAGWDADRLREALDLWDAWHLNDMTAGCEHQRAGIAADDDDPSAGIAWDARPIDPSKPTNAYGTHYEGQRQPSWNMLSWIRRSEHPAGLLSHPCPACGYKFGSAWLTREIPADVRARIVAVFGA